MSAQTRPDVQNVKADRVDGWDKALGRALYLDDLPVPHGCLHAAPILSTRAHALVQGIDGAAAANMPGVVAVVDRDHLHGMDPASPVSEFHSIGGLSVGELRLLATERVRFEGDLIGMVVADDRQAARAAARAVRVDYADLPFVGSYSQAMRPGAAVLHENDRRSRGSNLAFSDEFAWGDVDAALAVAPHVSHHEYYAGNAFQRPIEPTTSCLALPDGDDLTVWASLNQPARLADILSPVIGLPRDQIRVRVPYVGGGFGAKHITPAVVCASAVAYNLCRPVKYIASDHESFRTTARHAIRYYAKVGYDDDGNILALDVTLEVDTGAYFTGAALVTHNACISAWGCYRVPNFRVRGTAAYTNKVPAAAFRATGKNTTTFAIECIIDEVARRLGVPADVVRRRNILKRGELIAEKWRVRGVEMPSNVPPMDTDLDVLLDRAMEGIRWQRESAPPPADGARVRGRGSALSLRHGTHGGGRTYAMATMDASGTVHVHHNAPDLGSGVYTVLSTVAAATLGLPIERIRVGHPDSANGMFFAGTAAQRTTVQMGGAVHDACNSLIAEIIDVAAQSRGGRGGDWRYEAGRVWRGQESFDVTDVLKSFRGKTSISAIGSFGRTPSEDAGFGALDGWAAGAAAAEVEVDCNTGQVRVLQYCAVADAGCAIHPVSAVRQVEGGVVMGLGLALSEDLVYDESGLANGDAWSYRVPTMAELPENMSVVLVENADGPGPFGAKGLAQTSLPCTTPAIANAIRDAIGCDLRVAPFTSARILGALR
ncbi:MAG TPA: xanthine dehydrogenase family protein molybdopterin-binding subunit, partial [Luteitalea sp.]|nr:xanthine dehydrogenase family protein molybdopterin-binding subunit [Luteitalea sp.]